MRSQSALIISRVGFVSVYDTINPCIYIYTIIIVVVLDGKTNLPLLRKTGFENCQAVVMLCVLADGRVLPPAVVLRGSESRKVVSDGAADVFLMYQEQGVVDLDVVEGWIKEIWSR